MTATVEFGSMFGSLSCGYLADRYLRKRTTFFGSIGFMIGHVLQVASQDYAMLVVSAFICREWNSTVYDPFLASDLFSLIRSVVSFRLGNWCVLYGCATSRLRACANSVAWSPSRYGWLEYPYWHCESTTYIHEQFMEHLLTSLCLEVYIVLDIIRNLVY